MAASIKRAIKIWQKSFQAENDRKPTSNDVRTLAPPHILNLYQQLRDLSSKTSTTIKSNTTTIISTALVTTTTNPTHSSSTTWARRKPVIKTTTKKIEEEDDDVQDRRFTEDLEYMRYKLNSNKQRSLQRPSNQKNTTTSTNTTTTTNTANIPSFTAQNTASSSTSSSSNTSFKQSYTPHSTATTNNSSSFKTKFNTNIASTATTARSFNGMGGGMGGGSARGSLRSKHCHLHTVMGITPAPHHKLNSTLTPSTQDIRNIKNDKKEKEDDNYSNDDDDDNDNGDDAMNQNVSKKSRKRARSNGPAYTLKHANPKLLDAHKSKKSEVSVPEGPTHAEKLAAKRAAQVSTNFVRTELRFKNKTFRKKGGWGKNRAVREKRAQYNANTKNLYGADGNSSSSSSSSSSYTSRGNKKNSKKNQSSSNGLDVIDRLLDAEQGLNVEAEQENDDKEEEEEGVEEGDDDDDDIEDDDMEEEEEDDDMELEIEDEELVVTSNNNNNNNKVLKKRKRSTTKPKKSTTKKTTKTKTKKKSFTAVAPFCSGHQLPCKSWTVRKTGANKGRKFWSCPMDRSERCDFFSWADNTSNAAIDAYNKKKSGGINSREDDRMASYIRRWKTMRYVK